MIYNTSKLKIYFYTLDPYGNLNNLSLAMATAMDDDAGNISSLRPDPPPGGGDGGGPPPLTLDLPSVKAELMLKFAQCQQRGLAHTAKWLAEILHALR